MDFGHTREQDMLRNMVREFADNELAPKALAMDEKGELPLDALKRMGELGLVGILNSQECGGSAMGHLARMITIEEISRIYPPLGFFLQTGNIGMYQIEVFGSQEQKQEYLPPLCRAEKVVAFALTEQSGGSEPGTIQTTAEPAGEDYVVNGRKTLITMATVADLVVFVARTGEGFNAFILEKETPGYEPVRRETRLGFRSIPVGEFALTNCRIPKRNLLGQEGRGMVVGLTGISAVGRTGAAGIGLGVARGCYEAALNFAKERVLYGKPIAQLQAIQFSLADMDVAIEAARWLCYYVSWLLDQGKSTREVGTEIARAKLYACDVAKDVASRAVEVLGGYGLAPEYHVVRLLRDALELAPVAGTQEIMRVTIGAAITR